MTNRTTATMLDLIRFSLARLLPQPGPIEVPHPWITEDSSWHNSSFELARGLEVIEHRGVPPTVFADTMPAFHPPRA
jgi:hypothetical protein